jgi:glycosyltransferase involved in cell wall biosynthesis
VVKQVPGATLHVFGKDGRADDGGSMQQFLYSLVNGESSSIHFHGHVARRQLFDAYRTAGVAVFPSYTEAFALAPLEAMAVGCPTIFSDRGSGPELLTHGQEGLLVNPDSPDDIAESILRVVENPSFAAEIGRAGRIRVEQTFSVDRLVLKNESFYERCCRNFQMRSDQP